MACRSVILVDQLLASTSLVEHRATDLVRLTSARHHATLAPTQRPISGEVKAVSTACRACADLSLFSVSSSTLSVSRWAHQVTSCRRCVYFAMIAIRLSGPQSCMFAHAIMLRQLHSAIPAPCLWQRLPATPPWHRMQVPLHPASAFSQHMQVLSSLTLCTPDRSR